MEEFLAQPRKFAACVICTVVDPKVRVFIEDATRQGRGATSIANFLGKKGLWKWSYQPIRNHGRLHMDAQ